MDLWVFSSRRLAQALENAENHEVFDDSGGVAGRPWLEIGLDADAERVLINSASVKKRPPRSLTTGEGRRN